MDANPGLEFRESAPYGQACVSCSRAKCKCITRGQGTSCERCHRLRRECQPSVPVRKRIVRRSATRTTHLEDKLDDLVTLLRTQASAPANASGTSPQVSADGLTPETSLYAAPENERLTDSQVRSADETLRNPYGPASQPRSLPSRSTHGRLAPPKDSSTRQTGFATPSSISSPAASEPSVSESEQMLQTFRDVHLRMLPFTYLPTTITYVRPITNRWPLYGHLCFRGADCLHSAAQLQRERPFLWLNIRATCCKSMSDQRALDATIRETLARTLLIDLDRNMDLLQGLVAFLAWYVTISPNGVQLMFHLGAWTETEANNACVSSQAWQCL